MAEKSRNTEWTNKSSVRTVAYNCCCPNLLKGFVGREKVCGIDIDNENKEMWGRRCGAAKETARIGSEVIEGLLCCLVPWCCFP